jgi:excisionase family DNA binding protein
VEQPYPPAEPQKPRRRPYKLNEAAAELDVPLDTVRDAVARGDLKSFKVGRRRLIPAPYFERLLLGEDE